MSITMKTIILGMMMLWHMNATMAQSAEVKNNKIVYEGKSIAKIEKEGCTPLSPTCNFHISSLKNKPLMSVVSIDMTDPDERSASNPEGKVRFFRFSFTHIDGIAEVKNPAILATKPKDVAQVIVQAGLIDKNGQLHTDKVQEFIENHGTRYSERLKELLQRKNSPK